MCVLRNGIPPGSSVLPEYFPRFLASMRTLPWTEVQSFLESLIVANRKPLPEEKNTIHKLNADGRNLDSPRGCTVTAEPASGPDLVCPYHTRQPSQSLGSENFQFMTCHP